MCLFFKKKKAFHNFFSAHFTPFFHANKNFTRITNLSRYIIICEFQFTCKKSLHCNKNREYYLCVLSSKVDTNHIKAFQVLKKCFSFMIFSQIKEFQLKLQVGRRPFDNVLNYTRTSVI